MDARELLAVFAGGAAGAPGLAGDAAVRMRWGLWVVAGALGGLGALARFAVDGAVIRRAGQRFWLGILTVNLSGAFALGVLAGTAPGQTAMRLAGTVVLG